MLCLFRDTNAAPRTFDVGIFQQKKREYIFMGPQTSYHDDFLSSRQRFTVSLMKTTLFVIIIDMDPFRHGFHGSVPFFRLLRSSVPVPHNRYRTPKFCQSNQL